MVYLLGCDHYLQEYDRTESIDELWAVERETKEQFYELAKNLIESERIQFVGEECRQGQKTIPRVLATELSHSYAEIDMSLEERDSRGIARDYQTLSEEERTQGYKLREDYMVQRVYSESGASLRKLIVCGAEHLNGLEARFRERREEVTTRDLTKEDWVLAIYRKKEEFILQRVRR
jgi:pheromone shutdown protein TraB